MPDKPNPTYKQHLRNLAKRLGHSLTRFEEQPDGTWYAACTRCDRYCTIVMNPPKSQTRGHHVVSMTKGSWNEPCDKVPAVPKIYQ